jgi:hypothetical protein
MKRKLKLISVGMYNQKGFSLIDLMSVVAVVGIVFAPSFESIKGEGLEYHQYLKTKDTENKKTTISEFKNLSFKYKICDMDD